MSVEKIQAEWEKFKKNIDENKIQTELLVHPYTCDITGEIVDKPCWECTIYKQLDINCKWKPKR